jgi:hypothetical protein
VRLLREALGDEPFASLWAEGRAMDMNHAVSYAPERVQVLAVPGG